MLSMISVRLFHASRVLINTQEHKISRLSIFSKNQLITTQNNTGIMSRTTGNSICMCEMGCVSCHCFLRWINTATVSQLQKTKSIGKLLSKRIIMNRSYDSTHDVDSVKMIGKRRIMHLLNESLPRNKKY